MLLKISLGLAILLGVATIFLTHDRLGGKITDLTTQLNDTQTQLTTSQQNEQKQRADNKTLKASLDDTTRVLGETTNALVQAQSKAVEQQQRADRAAAELNEVAAQRTQAQNELAQWRLFEMTPDQIRTSLTRLRQVERERDTFVVENKALDRKRLDLERQLRRFVGDEVPEVQLPPGTKGNIVAVDPKYDFVILNIGREQGVLENAKMLVNRDGKLVGRVQITNVEPNRSVANILQEWKQDELMEGDQVIF
ncbi:MAG TPA: hypothetical protein VF773_21730 [Verrucomicrobiae bacterium]